MKCKKKDCKYRTRFSNSLEFCDYLTITGKPRNCDPANCDKYEKRSKARGKGQVDILISKDRRKIIAYREGGSA